MQSAFATTEPIIITELLDPYYRETRRIRITDEKLWFFKEGSSTQFATEIIDTSSWIRMSPRGIDRKMVLGNDFFEGWYRTTFKIDSQFSDSLFYLDLVSPFSAYEVFLDGELIHKIGNMQEFQFVVRGGFESA